MYFLIQYLWNKKRGKKHTHLGPYRYLSSVRPVPENQADIKFSFFVLCATSISLLEFYVHYVFSSRGNVMRPALTHSVGCCLCKSRTRTCRRLGTHKTSFIGKFNSWITLCADLHEGCATSIRLLRIFTIERRYSTLHRNNLGRFCTSSSSRHDGRVYVKQGFKILLRHRSIWKRFRDKNCELSSSQNTNIRTGTQKKIKPQKI